MALQQSAELRDLFMRFYQALDAGDVVQVLDLLSAIKACWALGPTRMNGGVTLSPLSGSIPPNSPNAPGGGALPGRRPPVLPRGDGGLGRRPGAHPPAEWNATCTAPTAVFRREGDAWKLVQSHASIGVRNADAFGTELTT